MIREERREGKGRAVKSNEKPVGGGIHLNY